MQSKQTGWISRSFFKKIWMRGDTTCLDLGVSIGREGSRTVCCMNKKKKTVLSKRRTAFLLRKHIFTHTNRQGWLRSEDQGSAVILWPWGGGEVERHARGYGGSSSSTASIFDSTTQKYLTFFHHAYLACSKKKKISLCKHNITYLV